MANGHGCHLFIDALSLNVVCVPVCVCVCVHVLRCAYSCVPVCVCMFIFMCVWSCMTSSSRAWRILVSSADNPPQTPVTPYPNRQPSLEQYSLDTMARPNQLSLMKRPTVTVLMTPGGGTPSSPLTSPDRRASTRP